MPIVVSDPTSASFNSYVSLTEAEAYQSARLHNEAWMSASDEDKERSVIYATRLLDYTYTWRGYRSDPEQPLDWPRTGVYDSEEEGDPSWSVSERRYYGRLIPDGEIPRRLKDATAEMALFALESDRTKKRETTQSNISEIKVGEIGLKFQDYNRQDTHQIVDVVPNWVDDIVSTLVEGSRSRSSGGRQVRVVRS